MIENGINTGLSNCKQIYHVVRVLLRLLTNLRQFIALQQLLYDDKTVVKHVNNIHGYSEII